MKSKIKDELLIATKIVDQKDTEPPERFRARLLRATDTLEDDVWSGLSEVAQQWINDGIDLLEKQQDILQFPDAVEELIDQKTTSKPAPVPSKPKRGTISHEMRKAILLHPDANSEELRTMLSEAGLTIAKSSAEVIYYETRGVIRVLQELNMLKENP